MNTSEPVARTRSARWQRLVDRLARWSWPIVLVSVALALLGSVALAVWNPETGNAEPYVDPCENPPCFRDGGLPGAHDLPITLPFLGYGLEIMLGLPSLLAGGWDLLRGR